MTPHPLEIPELLDREVWDAPKRMSRDEACDQIGAVRDRNHRISRDTPEKDDQ